MCFGGSCRLRQAPGSILRTSACSRQAIAADARTGHTSSKLHMIFNVVQFVWISSIVLTLFKILPFDFARVAFSNRPFKFLGFSPALAMPAAPVPHPLLETAGPHSCFFHKAMTVWTCQGTDLPGHWASLSVHQQKWPQNEAYMKDSMWQNGAQEGNNAKYQQWLLNRNQYTRL